MSTFYNLIYYKAPASLYVNLYTPSEVTWNHQGNEIKVIQETEYPAMAGTLTMQMPRPAEFSLQFRVPQWSRDMSVKVNGGAADAAAKPGSWAKLTRTWNSVVS